MGPAGAVVIRGHTLLISPIPLAAWAPCPTTIGLREHQSHGQLRRN